MDTIFTQLGSLVNSTTGTARAQAIDKLRALQYTLETPYETLQRLAGQHLQIAGARIGVDLRLFNVLDESETPLSVVELASKCSCDEELMGRLCRYLASVGLIRESHVDHFTTNNVTKTLAEEPYRGAVHHFFDTLGPITQDLPDFLLSTQHKNITDASKTVLQKTFTTDLVGFQWFPTQPEPFAHFQQFMTVQRAGTPDWLSVYPIEEQLRDFSGATVFVDIGGGFGHQCLGLKAKHPDLPGKVVLQDLPQTFEHAPSVPGVEVMSHDFFTPQPVQGAKFYYFRNILHDWPDELSVEILKAQIPACGPESRVLIDEVVVPDSGANWRTTTLDLMMMAGLGSKERTLAQWRGLLRTAGLKIVEIHTYSVLTGDSVIECVPEWLEVWKSSGVLDPVDTAKSGPDV